MILLVDSHVLVWAALTPDRLSARARKLLEDGTTDKVVSVVSLWELAMKASAGKLELPAPPELAAEALGAAELAVTRPHLVRFRELPPLHGDPFDRMLVAQAIDEGLVLLTSDRNVQRYPVSWIW